MSGATAAGPNRVVAVDGLRGIAATLDVVYHLHEALARTATGWLWSPLEWIARHGYLGVDIFVVLSGFVIALSVSRGAPTLGYFGRFILRRSIRLDPPYWSAIVLELLLLYLTLRLFPDIRVELPSGPKVLAHLFYAQELLGYGSIVPIFWTLCYEIQFYAFFVGLVVLRAALPGRLQARGWVMLYGAALFSLSLWTHFWRPAWLPYGLAIDRWFQFFIGVLTWRAVTHAGAFRELAAAWVALIVASVAAHAAASQYLAIAISAWLVAATRDPRWARPFSSRPLQFLGAISYSLYLYHSSVGWRFVSLVQRLVPGPWGAGFALGVYAVGILGCIAFAALLWRVIERPCLTLCHRVRLPLRPTEPARPVLPTGTATP